MTLTEGRTLLYETGVLLSRGRHIGVRWEAAEGIGRQRDHGRILTSVAETWGSNEWRIQRVLFLLQFALAGKRLVGHAIPIAEPLLLEWRFGQVC